VATGPSEVARDSACSGNNQNGFLTAIREVDRGRPRRCGPTSNPKIAGSNPAGRATGEWLADWDCESFLSRNWSSRRSGREQECELKPFAGWPFRRSALGWIGCGIGSPSVFAARAGGRTRGVAFRLGGTRNPNNQVVSADENCP
jgi:hypothetical protein